MHYRHFDLQGLFGYDSIFSCALATCLVALMLSMIRYAHETFESMACAWEWYVKCNETCRFRSL